VVIDGQERARLGRGDFFGEIAALTGDAPTADVVAATLLRCVTVAGPELESFLLEHPRVMYRMLQAEARRLRTANLWLR
jgi:CRP-like cAMP-binding protein